MTTQMQRILVDVRKPKFVLDYVGDKEGFFLYWLKKRTFLDINTFYMSAKFYNAKTGQFTKLMTDNKPDGQPQGPPLRTGWHAPRCAPQVGQEEGRGGRGGARRPSLN